MTSSVAALMAPLFALFCALTSCGPAFGSTLTLLSGQGSKLPAFDVSFHLLVEAPVDTFKVGAVRRVSASPWNQSSKAGSDATALGLAVAPKAARASLAEPPSPSPLVSQAPLQTTRFSLGPFVFNLGTVLFTRPDGSQFEFDFEVIRDQAGPDLTTAAPVPLPATWSFPFVGLMCLWLIRRRRTAQS